MVTDETCPVGVIAEALKLASQIEVGEIPLDFDPGDVRWKEILTTIADQFSNHATLQQRLEGFLGDASIEVCDECDLTTVGPNEHPCDVCVEHWLAEHRLWEAALEASETAYQRWLAKVALERAAKRKT